jgi:hypothetical protein
LVPHSEGDRWKENVDTILTLLGKWFGPGGPQGRHNYRESMGGTLTGRVERYRRQLRLHEG